MELSLMYGNVIAAFAVSMCLSLYQPACNSKSGTGQSLAHGVDSTGYANAGPGVMTITPDHISSITYLHHSGEKHVAIITDGAWHYAGMEVMDDEKVKQYLMSITAAKWGNYMPDYMARRWDERLILEGDSLVQPVILTFYGPERNRYLIHSSEVPTITFVSDSCGLYKQLITDFKSMWP